MSEPHVVIHTDGACSGNPGPGGWGAILAFGDHVKEMKGGEPHTTNNRMELMAAISALEALKRPCLVDLHTDSQYMRDGIMKWIHGWKRNGWRTADKKPVKNVDLWQRLDAALAPAPGQLALGEGPCRPCRERARRRAGARRNCRDPLGRHWRSDILRVAGAEASAAQKIAPAGRGQPMVAAAKPPVSLRRSYVIV